MDNWIPTLTMPPTDQTAMYWVTLPDERVIMCRLNDYRDFGPNVVCWQSLSGDDIDFSNTQYIALKKPSPAPGMKKSSKGKGRVEGNVVPFSTHYASR